jgi:hypothetical protein
MHRFSPTRIEVWPIDRLVPYKKNPARLLNGSEPLLMVTDPPYGIQLGFRRGIDPAGLLRDEARSEICRRDCLALGGDER